MPSLQPAQQDIHDWLRARYGRVRAMRGGDGSVILFGMTEQSTVCRMHVTPSGHGRPATHAEVQRAYDLALAHVRQPCPACGYPARRPACANCGRTLADAA